MNWLISILQKEARGRRFNTGDGVRFLTTPRKGKGSTVLMPDFRKGRVTEWNRETNRYSVDTGGEQPESHDVHPRNMIADGFKGVLEPTIPIPETPPAPAPEPSSVPPEGVVL